MDIVANNPSRFLDTLLTVPHLARMCAEEHALMELLKLCTESHAIALALITEVTVDLKIAFPELRTRSRLVEVLKKCRLRRVCVLLPLNFHGERVIGLNAVLVMSQEAAVPASVVVGC